MNISNIDKLTNQSKERHLLDNPKTILDEIKAYMSDSKGIVVLSEDAKKTFDRWKAIHYMRVDGYNRDDIMNRIRKMYDVSDATIYRDFKNYPQVFKHDFDADYELHLCLSKLDNYISKAERLGDFKTIAKFNEQKIKLLQFFKGDGSLPSPDLFTHVSLEITAKPEDIGITDTEISVEKLLKMFSKKKEQILQKQKIEDAEFEEL
jgi:hypothetical protein